MSIQLINQYYSKLDRILQFGGSRNETAIRSAFLNLLNEYARKRDLELVAEVSCMGTKGKPVTPDGIVKNVLRLDYGYWESKDEADDLDEEINKKLKKGYPTSNIFFEDSSTAILIQQNVEVMRVDMRDASKLDKILTEFMSYEHPEVKSFNEAIEHFKQDIPTIVRTLHEMIESQNRTNETFQRAIKTFHKLCKEAINPDITFADLREMLIQHILTEEIFISVFSDAQFHHDNNVAKELNKVEETFFTGQTKRHTLDSIKNYYEMIKAHATSIVSHHEKQKFLKIIYENFYKAYNPKGADKLGIVYTPNEIVKFIIESLDYLLHKHFGKTLADKNVEFLDPATGTGTFVCDLIDSIPNQHLAYKYRNEIHANEVAILPYYIANLNIEYTFKQKMGYYEEFTNICFVDTLDNVGGLDYSGKQPTMFGFGSENAERIRKQNKKKISVIMGNPPDRANQRNENENNKNREYPEVDRRIRDTYLKESTAQKTKLYDMYTRFLRWSSDRIDKNGIIAFVSNNSFVDSRGYDGFRKVVEREFNAIYIVDLKGNARTSGERRRREGGNVFDDAIRMGIAVYFVVKSEKEKGCKINYNTIGDYVKSSQKREYLSENKLQDLKFEHIQPDKKHNWINLADTDFEELLPLASKIKRDKKRIFEAFSNGVSTNRDEWVYDFNKKSLSNKINFFMKHYNGFVDNPSAELTGVIKWSRDLKNKLKRKVKILPNEIEYILVNYRPFVKNYMALNNILIDVVSLNRKFFLKRNRAICLNTSGKDFRFMAVDNYPDLHFTGDTKCFPLYCYDDHGKHYNNITDWALEQFVDHYGSKKITKEDIFHYTYAVLHNPEYRKKYELNLKRDFPRLPFYEDFFRWRNWGKALMDLHINYESAKAFPLKCTDADMDASPKQKTIFDPPKTSDKHLFGIKPKLKVKLKADKVAGTIEIDEQTVLSRIPQEAWEHRLGNLSALEWILDQYKESKPSDPTIAEKFNTYQFADYKEEAIELLKKVCTVSVETVKIIEKMSGEE